MAKAGRWGQVVSVGARPAGNGRRTGCRVDQRPEICQFRLCSVRTWKDTGTDEKPWEVKPQVSQHSREYCQVTESGVTEPGLQAGSPAKHCCGLRRIRRRCQRGHIRGTSAARPEPGMPGHRTVSWDWSPAGHLARWSLLRACRVVPAVCTLWSRSRQTARGCGPARYWTRRRRWLPPGDWNPGPPDSIAYAVRLIWPHRLRAGDVRWPPPAFPNDSFDRLVNWDMALRHGVAWTSRRTHLGITRYSTKYSNLTGQHRPHAANSGRRPAPTACIDLRATRSHRSGQLSGNPRHRHGWSASL